MTCLYPGCTAGATHVYDLDDHKDEPAHYCGVHAPNLARRLGRIAGVGKPGSTPPTGPSKPPARAELNELQGEALHLLARADVVGVRTHYGRTEISKGPHGYVVDVNSQTLRALVRRGYVTDDCRPTPAGRDLAKHLAAEVRRG